MALEEVGAKLVAEGEAAFKQSFDSCQRAIDDYAKSIDRLEQAQSKTSRGFDNFKNSATELKAKFDLAKQAIGAIEDVLDKTIGATLRYSDQVRDLARASGASAEESSKFIQVADDLQVSFDALKMAAKSSADQGIVLTVDAMADLQKQYQAIQDPAERANFAIKMFGRSGLEMQKILEMDTAAFLAMADGIDESLIMTDEQVKSARDLEIAMDDMGDSVQGVVYAFSKALIPILTSAAGAMDQLIEIAGGFSGILAQHEKDVRKTAKSYDDYGKEMIRAKLAAGGVVAGEAAVQYELEQSGLTLEEYILKMGGVSTATFGAIKTEQQMAQALKDSRDAALVTAAGFDEFASSLGQASSVTKTTAQILKDEAAAAAALLKSRMDDLTLSISGPVGKAVGEYNEKQHDLNLTISTTAQKIQILNKQKFKTPEQIAELDALKGKLQEAQTASINLKTEFEDASKRMIFSMLQTKLAADGLTKDEVENLIRLAEHWGLVDKATANTAIEINKINLSNGKAELKAIDDILTHINGLPRNYNYDVNVTHTTRYFEEHGGTAPKETGKGQRYGGEQLAGGGSFKMPDWVGYEGWQVGPGVTASGGERVIVLPKTMSAGPVSNNYSTANNYNLNVMTSQSPAVVQRSFALMKMLAG